MDALYTRVKQTAFLATDRLHTLRLAIQASFQFESARKPIKLIG